MKFPNPSAGFFLLLFLIFFSGSALAQTHLGFATDRRAGVHAIMMNPAAISGSKMKLDINLFSASLFAGNDYASIDLSNLGKFEDGFNFGSDVETNPLDQNNFLGNVDILGPAVLFHIGDKNSFAFSTRVRGFFTLNNIAGEFYQAVSTDNEELGDFTASMEDLDGVIHPWGEVGLSYARILLSDDRKMLSAGATVKYLAGAGGVFLSSGQLGANYNASTESLTTTGNLDFGISSGFDSDEIDFSTISSGFGLDLGVVYEVRDASYSDTDTYKLRMGISVMDIGGISYAASERYLYNMNGMVSVSDFENQSLEEILDQNYPGTERREDLRFAIPTTLQVFADYAINKAFFVSASGSLGIKDHGDLPVSRTVNHFQITPRWESKWISVSSPVGTRQYSKGIHWGLGLRVGPLVVGSGSVLTNLISSSSQSADFYVGLKIPIYQ
ncbi:DUF5723 family protein [Algoriphagus litoralis]|uniref:DUF5723 family protein n=1 Tax=Algoriphagus litoralis TaxID=2202829 RepID=UPI000DB9097B|nr:DUF5723 family protein [Algoriphagus litoralis]